MIIDSHLHLNAENDDYNQPSKDLLTEMDRDKIETSIIIADNMPNSGCADTATLLRVAGNNPRIKVIGSPNVLKNDPKELEYFDQLLKEKKIVGLKLFPGHDPIYPTDQRCETVYELALKYDCPVTIHTGINTGDEDCAKYNDPKHIVAIACKYPKLTFIIAHYFWPKLDYCYELTKNIENIYFDTSALADQEVLDTSGGIEKMREILEKTIRDKSDGVIFGTDYPGCNTLDHINLINSLNISSDQKENIFFKNSAKIFKF